MPYSPPSLIELVLQSRLALVSRRDCRSPRICWTRLVFRVKVAMGDQIRITDRWELWGTGRVAALGLTRGG
jgi:hypothetical protein